MAVNPDVSLRDMIKKNEGLRLIPYYCNSGVLTVGYGHNLAANPLPAEMQRYFGLNGRITITMAEDLLKSDILKATQGAVRLYPDFHTFSMKRKHALIDMCFNLGYTRLSKFVRTNNLINAGKWIEAAENLKSTKWYSQVGNRSLLVCQMLKEG